MTPEKARSAIELADAVLTFRGVHEPHNARFVHRALLVDNGGRGSDQKSLTFDADDLSALMMDMASFRARLATAEAENARLRDDLANYNSNFHAVLRSATERCLQAEADLTALRESHAAAVEAAFREGRSSDQRAQDDAAWLASEARKGVTPVPKGLAEAYASDMRVHGCGVEEEKS